MNVGWDSRCKPVADNLGPPDAKLNKVHQSGALVPIVESQALIGCSQVESDTSRSKGVLTVNNQTSDQFYAS